MNEVKVVKTWDEMPPVVFDGDEAFSTRFLERKYREMEDAMRTFVERCEKGEVRSRRTYQQFKSILTGSHHEKLAEKRHTKKKG